MGAAARWEVRTGTLLSRQTELVVLAGVLHPIRELIRGLSPAPLSASAAERLLRSDEGEGPPQPGGSYYVVKLSCPAGSWQTGLGGEPVRDTPLPS